MAIQLFRPGDVADCQKVQLGQIVASRAIQWKQDRP